MKVTMSLLCGLLLLYGSQSLHAAESLDEQLDTASTRLASQIATLLRSRNVRDLALDGVQNDTEDSTSRKLSESLTRALQEQKIRLADQARHRLSSHTHVVQDDNRSLVSIRCVVSSVRGGELAIFRDRFVATD